LVAVLENEAPIRAIRHFRISVESINRWKQDVPAVAQALRMGAMRDGWRRMPRNGASGTLVAVEQPREVTVGPKSKRELRRRMVEVRQHLSRPEPLPTALEKFLSEYEPDGIPADAWVAVRPVHAEVMRRSRYRGLESFKKRSRDLAAYLAWRHTSGLGHGIADAMTFVAIDDYFRRALTDKSSSHLMAEGSANTRRGYLRRLAEDSNPGPDATPTPPGTRYQVIKPPYSAVEEAVIRRVASNQRRTVPRRHLCAVVGLCAGAGLDSQDFRNLRRRHIDDLGEDGITVHVPAPRPRIVMVRRAYEEILRAGLEGLRPGSLIIGTKQSQKNLIGKVVAKAEFHGEVPRIEAARLRATWLAWLVNTQTPLPVILDAAGLKTARTLVELIRHLPVDPTDRQHLRGEES